MTTASLFVSAVDDDPAPVLTKPSTPPAPTPATTTVIAPPVLKEAFKMAEPVKVVRKPKAPPGLAAQLVEEQVAKLAGPADRLLAQQVIAVFRRNNIGDAAAYNNLTRLVRNGRLVRLGDGEYKLPSPVEVRRIPNTVQVVVEPKAPPGMADNNHPSGLAAAWPRILEALGKVRDDNPNEWCVIARVPISMLPDELSADDSHLQLQVTLMFDEDEVEVYVRWPHPQQ